MKRRKTEIIKIPVPFLLIPAVLLLLLCGTPGPEKENTTLKSVINRIDGGPVVPREANTIYITPFDNRTPRMELPEKLMSDLRRAIDSDGRLAVVESTDSADIVLQGRIYRFQIQPLSFNKFGKAEKKRLRIEMSAQLFDRRKDKIIFSDPAIQSFTEFSETTPPIIWESQALDTVIESMSKRLLSKIIKGWYTDQMTNVEKGKKP